VKQNQEIFSSVVSIDPYLQSYFKNISGQLVKEDILQYSKKQYAISFLDTKSFINTIVSVSKNIPQEDLHDVIENKAYEELALDMAIAYQTNYIEIHNRIDENNRFFHVFVVDPLILENDFKPIVDQIKYIDYITPYPLLLKSLYSKEIIDDLGVHCFISFAKDDASLTIYQEQQYLYTKSLNFSLTKLHESFCELLGEQISMDAFMDILSIEGMATGNIDHQKYLIQIFSDAFLHVNDVITYAKRAFQIDKIDTLYVGCDTIDIPGLDEYAQTYLSITTYDFSFDCGFTNQEQYISQTHALMQLYTTIPTDERYECNFSTYHRPPPFVQRQSGKLILLIAASLIIAFIYPVTNWTLTYIANLKYNHLYTQYNQIHNTKIRRQATIFLKNKERKRLVALANQEIRNYNTTKNTLIKIHNIKVNYSMKAKDLVYLTKKLNQFHVQLEEIGYKQKNNQHYFILTLISNHNKNITELVKYLTKVDTGIYAFSLKDISYNAKKETYVSKLKAVLL